MSETTLANVIAELIQAANQQRGREIAPTLRDAMNQVGQLNVIDSGTRQLAVAQGLQKIESPSGLGLTAIFLGAGAEHGAETGPVLPYLIKSLLRLCQKVVTDDGEIEEPLDEELEIGLELLGQGTVANLSRDAEFIQKLKNDQAFIGELERVEPYSIGVVWILELLRKVSGEIVVLHGTEHVGVRIAYHNLSNCFHLFTLLQGALQGKMPGARLADAKVLAIAQGAAVTACNDEAWWHYGQPVGSPPDLMSSVFGEASPSSIGMIGGQQVMVLWPPILKSRFWDAGFFGPAIHAAPARVEVMEMLASDLVEEWRNRIGIPDVPPSKAWWKFW